MDDSERMGRTRSQEQARIERLLVASEAIIEAHPGSSIRLLPLPRLVDDSSWKFVVSDSGGRAVAFGLCSPECDPGMVREAGERAMQVRAVLPLHLRAVPLVPTVVAEQDGLWLVLYPYLRTFSSNPLLRRWQYLRVRRSILEWLLEVAECSRHAASANEVGFACQAVLSVSGMPSFVRLAARQSLDALERGAWKPMAGVCHNDFWPGNILLGSTEPDARFRFQVIDWGGATMEGFPVLDLVRGLARFGLDVSEARRYLSRFSLATGGLRVLRHELVAALGAIARSPGRFPAERLVGVAEGTFRMLDQWTESEPHIAAA